MPGKLIGIDLGTTNSCVCVMEDGECRVVPNAEGSRTTPSVVAFADGGEELVGHIAKRQAIANPQRTLFAIKRLIGQRYDSPKVQEAIPHLPFTVSRAPNGDAWVAVEGRMYAPPEISAVVLQELRRAAEGYLGEAVTDAVITVPAYFDDAQRQATKDAGRIAGLDVRRIVNEPTAAALAYGLGKKQGRELLAICDLGGGTFDFTLMETGDGVFEVLATSGDTFLGGEDFDLAVVKWMLDAFGAAGGPDISGDRSARQRLKEAAEKAKCELSALGSVDISVPFLAQGPGGPLHFAATLTREGLEKMAAPLVGRMMAPIRDALRHAGAAPSEIGQVILVGGQTRMPLVQRALKDFFGREPSRGVNPDEVVAVGAAIQGAVLNGEVKGLVLLDVAPLSLGIETAGGGFVKIIPRNTTVPARGSRVFTTVADGQSRVEIHVLQGEREMAEANRSLGRFDLIDLPPLPAGAPQIEVSFDIDSDGIVRASAKDLATKAEQGMSIRPSSGLSELEVRRMIRDAAAHREEDLRRRDELKYLASAEGLVYSCGRAFAAYGGDLPEDRSSEIKSLLGLARRAIAEKNVGLLWENEGRLNDAQGLLAAAAMAASGALLSVTGEAEECAPEGGVCAAP